MLRPLDALSSLISLWVFRFVTCTMHLICLSLGVFSWVTTSYLKKDWKSNQDYRKCQSYHPCVILLSRWEKKLHKIWCKKKKMFFVVENDIEWNGFTTGREIERKKRDLREREIMGLHIWNGFTNSKIYIQWKINFNWFRGT